MKFSLGQISVIKEYDTMEINSCLDIFRDLSNPSIDLLNLT